MEDVKIMKKKIKQILSMVLTFALIMGTMGTGADSVQDLKDVIPKEIAEIIKMQEKPLEASELLYNHFNELNDDFSWTVTYPDDLCRKLD